MLAQPLTMLRCERCRAVVSSAEAPMMIREGIPCGVCGGQLAAPQHAERSGALLERAASSYAER